MPAKMKRPTPPSQKVFDPKPKSLRGFRTLAKKPWLDVLSGPVCPAAVPAKDDCTSKRLQSKYLQPTS